MDEIISRDIDRFIKDNEADIFRDIARLVAVQSVGGTAAEGAPFGAGPAEALELGLRIARELGLKTADCQGKMGYAQLGEGEKYLATITHLDVVPCGDGWSHDPFTMTERDGYIVGRGVMDDKGPSVLCLYALKYLRERNVHLRYPVRALLGLSEERGMEDLVFYLENYAPPLFCFSPDANFPLCNGEKGCFQGRMISAFPGENIREISGGFAANAIPDKATALVQAKREPQGSESVEVRPEKGLWRLTAKGIGGHASAPAGTVNAIGVLVDFILERGLAGEKEEKFLRAVSLLHSDSSGASLGLAGRSQHFGPLTIIGGMIGTEKGRFFQTVDCRYPEGVDGDMIAGALRKCLGEDGSFIAEHDAVPFYMELDNPAVQACLAAYRAVTGDEARPYTIGGGTYARHFPNAVSFGPEHPERPAPDWAGPIHGVDEAACKNWLLEALKIYILTLIELESMEF